MQKDFELPQWARHLAVAVAYGLGFYLVDQVSEAYWYLPAGLRFSALLLLSYRYWPALVIGEFVVVAHRSFSCVDQFGLTWAIGASFPIILLVMPAVWLMRGYLPGVLGKEYAVVTARRIGAFLLGLAVLSLALTFVYRFRVSLGHFPPGHVPTPTPALTATAWDFLGDYLGAVTIVPLALMISELRRSIGSWQGVGRQLVNSSMLLEGLVLGGCGFGILTWIGSGGGYHEDLRQVARFLMVIPMAWMAMRFGWQGAAVGAASASVGVMLTMPDRYDAASLVAQAIMAIAATALLPLGARIEAMRVRERDLEFQALESKLFARRHVFRVEMGRREQADTLDHAYGHLQMEYSRLLHHLRFVLPEQESLVYRQQLQGMRHKIYKMVDALSPREWQRRGLEGALWNGPITQTLDESGIEYHVSEPQGALSQLSEDMKLSMFRLACEAVAYLLHVGACDEVRLRLRGGIKKGRGWAVLSVESNNRRFLESNHLLLPPEPDKVKMWLGATGMDMEEMNEHARLYDGQARIRVVSESRWRITLALFDGVAVKASAKA